MRLPLTACAAATLAVLAAIGSAPAAPALAAEAAPASRTLAYGPDPVQALDYWPGTRADAPLVVFVHGGGWRWGDKQMMDGSAKLEHWRALGYAVASVNYRLVPEARVEDQAADIAAALAFLKQRAAQLGFDGTRIALVGHSAGAHLVALVGTDPAYLGGAGLSLADIAGIVALDGAAYDVPAQMDEGPRVMQGTCRQAFGTDPARQAQLSPMHHAAAPNVDEFLILHVQREDGIRQSQQFAEALRRGGSRVTIQGLAGEGLRGHAQINRELGDPDYPATAIVDAFLAQVLG